MGDFRTIRIDLRYRLLRLANVRSLLAAAVLCALCQPALGGALGDFAEDATRERPKTFTDPNSTNSSDHKHDTPVGTVSDEVAGDCLDVCLGGVFTHGGKASWYRVRPGDRRTRKGTPAPRSGGEALLPFLRFDAAYGRVESDVGATYLRLEGGFGPIGVQARQSRYEEDVPRDQLSLTDVHGLYRMSFTQYVEVDLGLGTAILAGAETHRGLSATVPIRIHPSEHYGIEFRPSWAKINGNTVGDYDLTLMVGVRGVSLQLGYRWLIAPNESLNGPYVGMSFRY